MFASQLRFRSLADAKTLGSTSAEELWKKAADEAELLGIDDEIHGIFVRGIEHEKWGFKMSIYILYVIYIYYVCIYILYIIYYILYIINIKYYNMYIYIYKFMGL